MAETADPSKRPNISEYRRWLEREHNVRIDDVIENYYDIVTSKLLSSFSAGDFWLQLARRLPSWADEYLINRKCTLSNSLGPLPLLIKSFDSYINKTWRKNVRDNVAYPDSPPSGWLLPSEGISQVKDIIRTTVEVNYLDGVLFMGDRLTALGQELGLDTSIDLQGSAEGYYGAHFYVSWQTNVPAMDLTTRSLRIEVEIQLTTHLKQLVKDILHSFYERDRSAITAIPWQWEYETDEFAAHSIGHMVHFVEGTIVQIRDRQRRS